MAVNFYPALEICLSSFYTSPAVEGKCTNSGLVAIELRKNKKREWLPLSLKLLALQA